MLPSGSVALFQAGASDLRRSDELQRLTQGGGYLAVAFFALDDFGHPARVGGSDDQGLGHLVLPRSLGQGSEGVVEGMSPLDHPVAVDGLVERFHHDGTHAFGVAVGFRDPHPEVSTDRRQMLFRAADQAAPETTDELVEFLCAEEGARDIEKHPLHDPFRDAEFFAVFGQSPQTAFQRATDVAGTFQCLREHGPLLGNDTASADTGVFAVRRRIHPQEETEVVEMRRWTAEIFGAGGFAGGSGGFGLH